MDHGGCKLRYWDETYRHTTDTHLTCNSWISLNQSSHRIRGWWSSGCSPELVGSSAPKPWGYVSLLFVTFKLSIIFHPNWNGTSILLFNIFADTALSFIHTFRVGGVDPDEFDRVWGSSDIWYSNSRIIGPWSIQIVLICFVLLLSICCVGCLISAVLLLWETQPSSTRCQKLQVDLRCRVVAWDQYLGKPNFTRPVNIIWTILVTHQYWYISKIIFFHILIKLLYCAANNITKASR